MSDSISQQLQPYIVYYPNKNSGKIFHGLDFPWNSPQHEETKGQSPLPLLIPTPLPPEQSKKHHHTEDDSLHRTWFNTTYQEKFRNDSQQHFKFHLVSYNILSQKILDSSVQLYDSCSKDDLQWHRRKDRLLKELLRQDADILCLQEMQNDHYENEFRPKLLQSGYESIYLQRTGDKSDGCCIFYRRNRLKLIASEAVPFYQKDIRILDKDNCGLIALFQPLTPNATPDDLFCVATTHLLYSPSRGDAKLAQIQYFLAAIDRLATKDTKTNSHHPIILCGDFNAYPHSPLIEFLLNGHIKYDTFRCNEISGQTPTEQMKNDNSRQLPSTELLPSSFVTPDCRFPTSNPQDNSSKHNHQQSSAVLTHNKQLSSVYDLKDGLDVSINFSDEPNLVDYIFYTQQENDRERLNVLSGFNLFKQNQMGGIHLPNDQYPSDHFLLAAKFALKLRKGN